MERREATPEEAKALAHPLRLRSTVARSLALTPLATERLSQGVTLLRYAPA